MAEERPSVNTENGANEVPVEVGTPDPEEGLAGLPPPGELGGDPDEIAPPGDNGEGEPLPKNQLDLLRLLRAEVQTLQAFLANVRAGKVTVKAYADYIKRTKDDVNAIVGAIRGGDSVRRIRNNWEQMEVNPIIAAPESDLDAQEQLHYLDVLDAQINTIRFLVGTLTIPERVNDWLAKARPGYYIPFHLVFEDEIPVAEDRVRVLELLAYSPETLENGVVDAANGLIFYHSQNKGRQRLAFLAIFLAFLAATALVAAAAFVPAAWLPIKPVPLPTLLVGWFAVVIGVVVHIAVAAAKRRQQREGRPPIVAVGDLPMIVEAKMGQILMKLVWALIGFLGLVLATGGEGVAVVNSFLVGYSLDSVLELVGTSLEQQADAQVTSLKQQLGVTE